MRLGSEALAFVEETVRKALAGECYVRVYAPSRHLARRMFHGVSPHIEKFGGSPDPQRLWWRLPNGSCILIEVER